MTTDKDATTSDGDVQWLEGSISASHLDWEDVALSDASMFETGLRDLGLPAREVEEATSLVGKVALQLSVVDSEIDEFNDAHQHIRYFMTPLELEELYTRKLRIRKRLGNWFKGREFRVDRTEESVIDVPLFVLSAPAVDRCSASFMLATEATRNLSCDLKVYGTGVSGGNESTCRATCNFTAEAGEVKIVFVRAQLTVGEVTTLVNGTPAGQGTMIEAIEFPPPSVPGAKMARDADVSRLGAYIATYPLAEDRAGALEGYEYEYEQSSARGFSIGASAFGADLGLKVEITLQQSVGLALKLSGGHDYPLHSVAEGHGITWKLS